MSPCFCHCSELTEQSYNAHHRRGPSQATADLIYSHSRQNGVGGSRFSPHSHTLGNVPEWIRPTWVRLCPEEKNVVFFSGGSAPRPPFGRPSASRADAPLNPIRDPIPFLDSRSGCQIWIPDLDARSGFQIWIPDLDARSACQIWMPDLDARSGCQIWMPDPDAGSGCQIRIQAGSRSDHRIGGV